jgi:hypothetical protein
MIAEIIPEAYDAKGCQVSHPFDHRKAPRPTFPMGRYVSRPLTINCKTLEEIRQFLLNCHAESDEKLFGKKDYWQPPEEFEKRKEGDCEDFSFWTWRQLLHMGFDARIVFGKCGRYGIGHAWVMFFKDNKAFLVEPQARMLGLTFPRLSTLRYEPRYSIVWDGKTLKYYAHKDQKESQIPLGLGLSLLPEWLGIWGFAWLKALTRFPLALVRKAWHSLTTKAPPTSQRL